MNCVVTAGPTFEPLDEVRRLTNFSTGRLGLELANCLVDWGHHVTLLLGQQATCRTVARATEARVFTTAADLEAKLRSLAGTTVGACFHAAAVSDFRCGSVFQRGTDVRLIEIRERKYSSRLGPLLVELIPTAKIIGRLREWFPTAWIAGWKYELDEDQAGALAAARRQIAENRTNACVTNGPAYGEGFGLVLEHGRCRPLPDRPALYAALAAQVAA